MWVFCSDIFHISAIKANCDSKNSESVTCNFLNVGFHLLFVFVLEFDLLSYSIHILRAFVNDHLWCTFQKHLIAFLALIPVNNSRHAFTFSTEFQGANSLDTLHHVFRITHWESLLVWHWVCHVISSEFLCENFECSFRWLPTLLESIFKVDASSVIYSTDESHMLVAFTSVKSVWCEVLNFAISRWVGFFFNVVGVPCAAIGSYDRKSHSAHFVLRQCSCFIRTDDWCATKSFYWLKASHDAIVSSHLASSEGQASSYYSW